MSEKEIIQILQKINILDLINKKKNMNLPQFIKDMLDDDPNLIQKLKQICDKKSGENDKK